MSKHQTQSIKTAPYQIQSVSLKELVSGSELIEFLRVEIPYGKAYGRIPFARVLYAFKGIEQKKAVPTDLDTGAFSDSSFENVFEDEVLERTFWEIAPQFFKMLFHKSLRLLAKSLFLDNTHSTNRPEIVQTIEGRYINRPLTNTHRVSTQHFERNRHRLTVYATKVRVHPRQS